MSISVLLKLFPILFLSIGIFFSAFSQDKIEREVRVSYREVPSGARNWLGDAFEKIKRPKWYLEYSQNGRSYEAKFMHLGHFYSVEFDSLGNLEDVEIEIKESEVPVEVWKKIQSYFESEYEEFKVEKIQKQLTGSESDMEDFFDQGEVEGIVTRYEVVFQGKNEFWELWEALFDATGKFISIIKVQIRPNDNLVF